MYTEIKELVNFLALFLHERLPRRKVCLFSEQLANFLLLKYQEKWVISDPKMYEDDRILRIKAKGVTDNLIEVSATSTGVDLRELIGYITSSLVIYCNPGEVFYRVEEGSIAVPIWMGSVDEDDHYKPNPVVPLAIGSGGSNMGAAGRPHLPVPVAGRCDSSGNLRATDRTVPLSLVKENSELPLPVNGDHTLGTAGALMFRYIPPHYQAYTVASFAATRFGSHRQRPDYDAMRRIQRTAAFSAIATKADQSLSMGIPKDEGYLAAGDCSQQVLPNFVSSAAPSSVLEMENAPAAGTASFIRDSTYGTQQDPSQFYDHPVHMQFPVMYSQIPPPPISVTPAYIVGNTCGMQNWLDSSVSFSRIPPPTANITDIPSSCTKPIPTFSNVPVSK